VLFLICKGIVSHDSESNFWLYEVIQEGLGGRWQGRAVAGKRQGGQGRTGKAGGYPGVIATATLEGGKVEGVSCSWWCIW